MINLNTNYNSYHIKEYNSATAVYENKTIHVGNMCRKTLQCLHDVYISDEYGQKSDLERKNYINEIVNV